MIRKYLLFTSGLCIFAIGYGQPSEESLTINERLDTVELQLTMLDSRFNSQAAVSTSSLGTSRSDLTVQFRIDSLEREINNLRQTMRELSQQVDIAKREAADAQRGAREALSRIR